MAKEQRKSKRKWWIIVLVFLIIGALGSNKDAAENENADPEATPTVEATVTPEPTEEVAPEQGTTAMVDHIISIAKEDAGGPDAEAKAVAAYEWIVENVPQWYDGLEIMERAIYNGTLVEYFYYVTDRVRSDIGADTVQSVKYVYRGVETVLDNATQENIRQIKEGIEKARGD